MTFFGSTGSRPPERHSDQVAPPPNIIPGVVPFAVRLAHDAETAVTIVWIGAYPAGVELLVDVRTRTGAPRPTPEPAGPASDVRFGVAFSDGRVLHDPPDTGSGTPEPLGGAVLVRRGFFGDATGCRLRFWLHPLPPAGPLTFIGGYPARGLASSNVTIDAQPVRDAAGEAVELWPDGPAPARPGTPPADPAGATAAITAAFEAAFTGGQDLTAALGAVEDGPSLRSTLAEARSYFPVVAATARVTTTDIVFVTPTHALLNYRLSYEGGIQFATQRGEAFLVDGVWKVGRETYCTVLSWAGAHCPPRDMPGG